MGCNPLHPLLLLAAAALPVSCNGKNDAMPAIQQLRVDIPGAKLFLRSAGPADGPPILLLHGASFSSATWEELGTISLLAKEGWRVLAVDLPGYGETPAGGPPPEQWVGAILDALKVPAAALLAPSMSGPAALSFVAAQPGRVTHFIAVAPVGVPEQLSKIQGSTVPTLVLWSNADKVVPMSDGIQLVAVMDNARLEVFKDAPHPLYLMEFTGRFHEALLGFLPKP